MFPLVGLAMWFGDGSPNVSRGIDPGLGAEHLPFLFFFAFRGWKNKHAPSSAVRARDGDGDDVPSRTVRRVTWGEATPAVRETVLHTTWRCMRRGRGPQCCAEDVARKCMARWLCGDRRRLAREGRLERGVSRSASSTPRRRRREEGAGGLVCIWVLPRDGDAQMRRAPCVEAATYDWSGDGDWGVADAPHPAKRNASRMWMREGRERDAGGGEDGREGDVLGGAPHGGVCQRAPFSLYAGRRMDIRRIWIWRCAPFVRLGMRDSVGGRAEGLLLPTSCERGPSLCSSPLHAPSLPLPSFLRTFSLFATCKAGLRLRI
ncbi:hypothetical protein B0H19DRAFT_1378991 [Mycena capillaripes]|nr:hypothetical protein B0H19DRAFT_1378991 [Mycena capillaripes]